MQWKSLIQSKLTMNRAGTQELSSFLSSVALPVYQVLNTLSMATRAWKTFNRKNWTSIDELVRQRGRCGKDQRTLSERFHSGDMKCRVDPLSAEKLHMGPLGVNDL